MRQSVQYRLSYYYKNRFCNDSDKEQLCTLAEQALKELEAIETVCRLEKERIEEYPGEDWDEKFGVTGRWRQTVSDLNNTVWLKGKIDYYVDLSCGGRSLKNQKNRAKTVLERLKKEENSAEGDPNDFEANVRLAFARLRTGDDGKLRAVMEQWNETRYFFAQTILDCLESSGDVENLTLLETQLAAEAALASNCGRYKEILAAMEKSNQVAEPTILYAAGIGYAESEPHRAIEYFVRASRLGGELALISAEKAAYMAYQLYNCSKSNCPFVISVFRNYMNLAGDAVDETLQYCYSKVLRQCGEDKGLVEVLKKIAGRDGGKFTHRAEFELILSGLEKNKARKLRLLADKISTCEPVNNQLRFEVVAAYCREQLESDGLSNILEVPEVLAVIGQADCRLSEYVLVLFSKITERIDEYEAEMRDSVMQNCYNIAIDYRDCFQARQKVLAEIFCTELGTFAAGDAEVGRFLDGLEKIADKNSVDLLRCKARVLMTEGKYESAGLLWSRIAESKKPLTKADSLNNWQWWRAKYYELNCASKAKQTDTESIKHSAEVLLYSDDNIPEFWKAKLIEIRLEKL